MPPAYLAFSFFKRKPTRIRQIIIIGICAGIAKFIMSVIKATVMSMIAGAQLKPFLRGFSYNARNGDQYFFNNFDRQPGLFSTKTCNADNFS